MGGQLKKISEQTELGVNSLQVINIEGNSGLMLPLSSAKVPTVPNSLLRSAAFKAIQNRDIKYVREKPVASSKNVAIFFTGWELTQSDLLVWETILYMVKDYPIGSSFVFTTNELLTEMGKSPSKNTYNALRESIKRLAGSRIDISCPVGEFTGSLISSAFFPNDKTKFSIRLNEDTYKLYHLSGDDDWTFIDMGITQCLERKPLALQLYHFFTTHKNITDLPLSFYQKRTEKEHLTEKAFKQKFKQAMTAIKKTGFLTDFDIDKSTNIVDVTRSEWAK